MGGPIPRVEIHRAGGSETRLRGFEPRNPTGPRLRSRSARARSLWKSLRRRWKEVARGRPEDELVLGLRWGNGGRPFLEWAMLAFLALVPIVGLLMDPTSTAARVCLLLVTTVGLLAATQLDRDPGRAALVRPLTSSVMTAGLAMLLALGIISLGGPESESGLWIGFSLFPVSIGATALRDDGRLPALTAAFSAPAWLMLAHHARTVPEAGALAAQIGVIAVAGWLGALAAHRGRILLRAGLLHPGTGIMNRGAFEACVAREVSRAQRAGRPLSIGRIQLDAFSDLVGLHGRNLGDAVERYVSAALRDHCRTTDGVAHIDDGSFAIAFLDSAHPRLRERLEGLCLLLRDFEIDGSPDTAALQLAVRSGLAVFPRDGKDAEEVMTASERALRSQPVASHPGAGPRV